MYTRSTARPSPARRRTRSATRKRALRGPLSFGPILRRARRRPPGVLRRGALRRRVHRASRPQASRRTSSTTSRRTDRRRSPRAIRPWARRDRVLPARRRVPVAPAPRAQGRARGHPRRRLVPARGRRRDPPAPSLRQHARRGARRGRREGYNAVDFLEFTFVPTREHPDHDHPRYQETMRGTTPFSRARRTA